MTSTNWLDLLNEAKQNGGPQNFGPVPAGEYHLKVLEAETRQTQNGKTKYTIKVQVQVGPHAGRLIWDDLIVSPESAGAMGFFFRKMKALGLDEAFYATQPSDGQIVAALKDREFLGKVIVDTYGGKDRNKIDGYKPLVVANSGGFLPPAPQAASAAPTPPFVQSAPAPAPAPATQSPAPQVSSWDNSATPAPTPVPTPAPAGSPWDNVGSPTPAPASTTPSIPAPPF